MQLVIAAIGRMKNGPERELVQRYRERCNSSGKTVGISKCEIIEIAESREQTAILRKKDEARILAAKIPSNSTIICFDERGKTPDSRAFATHLQTKLDNGIQHCVMIIGGPDGLCESWKDQADLIVSFGKLTMPHQIVRMLVAEQCYRAISILSGHPYHRD